MIHAECPNPLPLNRPWPESLPTVRWQKWRLAGLGKGEVVDLSTSWLGEALKWCYPNLGIAEIANIVAAIPEQAESVCQAYDLRWNERLTQTLRAVLSTPAVFQKWVNEKQLGPRELFPLLAVPDLKAIEPILEQVGESALSRAQGAQALEYAIECFLMEMPLHAILENRHNWLPHLRRLRRPLEDVDNQTRDAALNHVHLPPQTTLQWLNGTDQPVLEVRLQAKSPTDLLKKLEQLKTADKAWSYEK